MNVLYIMDHNCRAICESDESWYYFPDSWLHLRRSVIMKHILHYYCFSFHDNLMIRFEKKHSREMYFITKYYDEYKIYSIFSWNSFNYINQLVFWIMKQFLCYRSLRLSTNAGPRCSLLHDEEYHIGRMQSFFQRYHQNSPKISI